MAIVSSSADGSRKMQEESIPSRRGIPTVPFASQKPNVRNAPLTESPSLGILKCSSQAASADGLFHFHIRQREAQLDAFLTMTAPEDIHVFNAPETAACVFRRTLSPLPCDQPSRWRANGAWLPRRSS